LTVYDALTRTWRPDAAGQHVQLVSRGDTETTFDDIGTPLLCWQYRGPNLHDGWLLHYLDPESENAGVTDQPIDGPIHEHEQALRRASDYLRSIGYRGPHPATSYGQAFAAARKIAEAASERAWIERENALRAQGDYGQTRG
jgi:hypothetical protein